MKNDNGPRVRFAPSPTGHLHIGGARTALFNWLYARKTGGVFILRVEDTDRQRSQPELTEEILKEMAWLGLDWDEGPYFQSERMQENRYLPHALGLLESGAAYREGGAVIFRVPPDEEVVFHDLVREKISTSTAEIKDIVLIKSDGSPAYNFACVVDDMEMGITHIVRGEDHIPNTPKQVLLYRALGWKPPKFAHLPLILGEDKAPLSKRHGATSLTAFREEGYIPAALVNYLALLGWSPGDGREFMTVDEIVKSFSLKRIIRRAAVFDYQKLAWLNGLHLRNLSPEARARAAAEVLDDWKRERGVAPDRLSRAVELLGHRVRVLGEIPELGAYLFEESPPWEEAAVERYWADPRTADLLRSAREQAAAAEPFAPAELEARYGRLIAERGLAPGDFFHPLRVALTGRADSPGIYEVMEFLGREQTLKRLDRALERLARTD
ncbi:MAG TPA: glutamate--tRNA ligase [bacterium]|nr:glutamate--tRNA ligase [bacterium]HPQ67280.1 glutamate--tRNA ligase [bacterium]